MTQKLVNFISLVIMGGAVFIGFQLVESQQAAEKWKSRYQESEQQFDDLKGTYNEVVKRTAVTELIVHRKQLSVSVRTAEGEIKRIETPFDPTNEIYVDYIVLDGRIWIRRVFDNRTPPEKGIVINPSLAEINWEADHVEHGKAVYRKLTDGRWVITVTGDGSLGLARAKSTNPPTLESTPSIRKYDEMD